MVSSSLNQRIWLSCAFAALLLSISAEIVEPKSDTESITPEQFLKVMMRLQNSFNSPHERLLQQSQDRCPSFCSYIECEGCGCNENSCGFCYIEEKEKKCLECTDDFCRACNGECECLYCEIDNPLNCVNDATQQNCIQDWSQG